MRSGFALTFHFLLPLSQLACWNKKYRQVIDLAILKLNLYSVVLQMQVDVWAVLPEPNPGLKWMVLLHGGSGFQENWAIDTNIEQLALGHGIAVFMPDGHDSCFVNTATGRRYGEYIGRELQGILRRYFPTLSQSRDDTWISGFSNGGYGAFLAGLAYPQNFGRIVAAGTGDKADIDWDGQNRLKEKEKLFGASTDMSNSEYSIKFLAKKLAEKNGPKPAIVHGCGENDPWLHMNHSLRDFFAASPFDYAYHEFPNEGHTPKAMELTIKLSM